MHVPFLENYFNFPSHAAACCIDFLGIFFLCFYHSAYRSISLYGLELSNVFAFLDFIFQSPRLPLFTAEFTVGVISCVAVSRFFFRAVLLVRTIKVCE